MSQSGKVLLGNLQKIKSLTDLYYLLNAVLEYWKSIDMITASMVLNKEASHQVVIKHWKANEEKYSSFTKSEKNSSRNKFI